MRLIFSLYFLLLFLGVNLAVSSESNNYSGACKNKEGVSGFCKDPSKAHKKWVREVLNAGINDKKRYQMNTIKFTANSDAKLKPKLLDFKGVTEKNSMKSYTGKGEMGIVLNAENLAFKGKEFWQVTTDFSKCKNLDYYSDCKQTGGSSRIENREINHGIKDGTEKWIHYAIKPVNNTLFPDSARQFTIGQCHPSDKGGHLGLTWMIRIRNGKLWFHQGFLHKEVNYLKEDGTWGKKLAWISHEDVGDYKVNHFLLKDFVPQIKKEMNGLGGDGEWTSILLRHKNSIKDDGVFELYIDNYDKPVYSYYGPTSIPKKKSCYLKFGLYTNRLASVANVNPTLVENMTVWYDAMAVAKTKNEVMALVEKDK